jgi:type I restriction enzyme S subunit
MGSKTVKIGDVCTINQFSYSKNDNWSEIKYLDTGSVIKGFIEETQCLNPGVDKVPSRARRKVKHNSIIYSMVRPNQEHYALLKQPHEYQLVSTGFSVLDAEESQILPEYLYYALTLPETTNYFQALAEQSVSTYPTLALTDLESFEFTMPPLEEQSRIVKITHAIDSKILNNRKVNDYLA